MAQKFEMLVPLDLTITSNRSSQIWHRKKVKDGISALTRTAARDVRPVGRATIYVGVTKRTHGRYDPVNLTDTVKAAIDTLVRMGILAEDDYRHVTGPWLYHKGVDKNLPAGVLGMSFVLAEYAAIEVEALS